MLTKLVAAYDIIVFIYLDQNFVILDLVCQHFSHIKMLSFKEKMSKTDILYLLQLRIEPNV